MFVIFFALKKYFLIMYKSILAWAIIWSIIAALCLLAIFWNPSHFITLAIALIFAVICWHDYKKTKGM